MSTAETKQNALFRMTYSTPEGLEILRDIFRVHLFTSSEEGHYAFDAVRFRFTADGLTVDATDGRRAIQRHFTTGELFESELTRHAGDGTEDGRGFAGKVQESMDMCQDVARGGGFTALFPSTVGKFSVPKNTRCARLTVTPDRIELDVTSNKGVQKMHAAKSLPHGVFPDVDRLIPPDTGTTGLAGTGLGGHTVGIRSSYLLDVAKAYPGQTLWLTVPSPASCSNGGTVRGTVHVSPGYTTPTDGVACQKISHAGTAVAIIAPVFLSDAGDVPCTFAPIWFDADGNPAQ